MKASIQYHRDELEETIFTNLDHKINTEIVGQLEDEKYYADHAAWNFYGYVYKKNEFWNEEIWQYNKLVDILVASSAEEVIEKANSKYGNN